MSDTHTELESDVERARRRYERTKSRTDLRAFAELRKNLFQTKEVLDQENPPQRLNRQ